MNFITEEVIKGISNKNLDNYLIEKSKDDRYILKVLKDEKNVYIGSKYSVIRDVESLMNKLKGISNNSVIIIFGLGTGEHINEIMNRYNEYKKLIIIEPDESIIRSFLSIPYSKDIFSNDKLFLCLFTQESFKSNLKYLIDEFDIPNLTIEHYANYNELYKTESILLIEIIRDYIIALQLNKNTHLHFSKTWFECYIKNLTKMPESVPINELKNTQLNKPAIIVSAGPSLEKNIELLKEFQDEFIIITGGRTLKTLLKIGVKPDLLCVVDPGLRSFELVEEYLDPEVPLLFYELSNAEVVEKHLRNNIFFNNFNYTNDFLKKDIASLFFSGSVAHVCTSAAVYMGCNPIIFIGQDLAYTGERLHAPSAEYGVELFKNFVAQDDIYVDDIFGNKVRTSLTLNFYRKELEGFINLYPEKEFINSTEGGANIKYTKAMNLLDACNTYDGKNITKNIKELLNNYLEQEIINENITSILEGSINKLISIKNLANRGVNLSNKLNMYYSKGANANLNSVINELNKIDSSINKEVGEVEFINFLLYPVINNIELANRLDYTNEKSIMDIGQKTTKKSKLLYEGIFNTINTALPIIKDVLIKSKSR